MSSTGGLTVQLLLAGLVVGLGFFLFRQIRERNRLRDWLRYPDRDAAASTDEAWGEIYSCVLRQRMASRRAQAALEEAMERFRMAVRALPDGVILLDTQTYIEWMNPSAGMHFSLDVTRDIGIRVDQLIRYSGFLALLEGFRDKGMAAPILLRTGENGAERILSVTLIRFADTGTLLLSHDVSESVRTETIHRDFIANVSHELRTPLTVITGFLEQFSSPRPPQGEAAVAFHRLMNEQAGRMNRLVADLLTLSRLENDNQPPREESVDVPAILAELRDSASALSSGRHTIEIAEVSAGSVLGCADELRSAFGNLLFNAVRYTPAGGKITLAWRLIDDAPAFSVTDTGIGIPAEHIPRLTERFYRVDKGRSTAAGGTGLGLAIVKHVLARHGGTLKIQSVPGRGSTFSAVLAKDRAV